MFVVRVECCCLLSLCGSVILNLWVMVVFFCFFVVFVVC